MNNEIYDTFDKFHSGKMSDEESRLFVIKLEQDQSLAKEYELFKVAIRAIEENIADDLRSQFKDWNEESKKPSLLRSIYKYSSIAAAGLILIGIFMTISSANIVHNTIDQELFQAHTTATRSADQLIPEASLQLEKADLYFKNGEYIEAINLYRQIQFGESEYNEAAEFREVLALYKSEGNSEGFNKLLEQILKNQNHQYYAKALILQEANDNFWHQISRVF